MADHHEHNHDEHEQHEHALHVHSDDPQHLLADFRAAKDDFFGGDPDSPLTEEQQDGFAGLKYYPYNAALNIEAPIDRDVSHDAVIMQTSTGEQQTYRRLGKISFNVGDQEAGATIYRSPHGDLFLPIRDATSGKETYGAGRYVEPEMNGPDRIVVDFNYLYNPYCAYNDAWSCPLPPVENWLKVPIEAGEKSFSDDH
jgi:uncharacterized protein